MGERGRRREKIYDDRYGTPWDDVLQGRFLVVGFWFLGPSEKAESCLPIDNSQSTIRNPQSAIRNS